MESLVWGRYLISMAPATTLMLKNGAVYIADGYISEVGTYADLKARHPSVIEIGSSDALLLPGLVNAHSHGCGVPFGQRGRKDQPLELFSMGKSLHGDVDPYWDTLFSCMKLIESGVTTIVHSHPDRNQDNFEWRATRTLQAYLDAGVRVAFALSIVDQNNFVYAPDDEFLQGLPAGLRVKVQAALDTNALISSERFFAAFHSLWEQFGRGNDGRVRILLAPVGPQWCTDDLLREVRRVADVCRTGIHVHLLESQQQKRYGLMRYGESLLAHMANLGLVGERVSFAHGVWLTEEDAAVLAGTGTSVVHNPSSNLRLGSGIAPVRMLLQRGVSIALGTDNASINDDEDFWTEMRLARYLHRLPGRYAEWPDEAQILSMATAGGAHVALQGDETGTLEPGKRADMILVRVPTLDDSMWSDPKCVLDLLMTRTTRRDVVAVIVQGDLLFRDGEFTNLERERVLDELRRSLCNKVREKSPLSGLTNILSQYIEAFYENWDGSDVEPIYTPNSRI